MEVRARRALVELNVEPVDNPLDQLALLAGQVVAWKDALAAKVNELSSVRYVATGAGTEQLRAEVAMFERALDRCMQVLSTIVKLGLEERLARISEQQALVVERAVDAALAHVGITGPEALAARRVAGRHLRGVEA